MLLSHSTISHSFAKFFAFFFGLLMTTLLASHARAIDFFFVTNTNDSGAGSLRRAINDANASNDGEENRIIFNIPGGGSKVIAPTTQLPDLDGQPTVIDGLTQPGADCSSWPPDLRIVLSGLFQPSGDGLHVFGQGHTIQGLVIHRFPGDGIQMSGASSVGGHHVRCNLIGTDRTGQNALPNGTGIFLDRTVGVTIGGGAVSDTNLISGNSGTGISVLGEGNGVFGNFIGTDVFGAAPIPNTTGVRISRGFQNQVGSFFGVGGNVIAGNSGTGLAIVGDETFGNVAIGNWIGVNTSLAPIPNETGVLLIGGTTQNSIGGNLDGTGNVIAFNTAHGIEVSSETTVRNGILRNLIYDNGLLGISLGGDSSMTPNDPGDADVGPNHLQNHPELRVAILDDANDELLFTFEVPSDPAHSVFDIDVDVYLANAAGDEGLLWLGRVTTDGASEIATLPLTLDAATLADFGGQILATATDSEGNTSEFGAAITVPEVDPQIGLIAGVVALFLALSRRSQRERSGLVLR